MSADVAAERSGCAWYYRRGQMSRQRLGMCAPQSVPDRDCWLVVAVPGDAPVAGLAVASSAAARGVGRCSGAVTQYT